MKSLKHFTAFAYPVIASVLCALPSSLSAQEDAAIRVNSTLHPDGSRTETVTNQAERTSEKRVVNAAGKQISRTIYTLGDDGQPASGATYNAQNQPVNRFQFVRDSLGNVKEQLDYTVAGELYQRRIYQYNTQGKVTGMDTYDGKGQLVHTTSGSGGSQQKQRRVPERRR